MLVSTPFCAGRRAFSGAGLLLASAGTTGVGLSVLAATAGFTGAAFTVFGAATLAADALGAAFFGAAFFAATGGLAALVFGAAVVDFGFFEVAALAAKAGLRVFVAAAGFLTIVFLSAAGFFVAAAFLTAGLAALFAEAVFRAVEAERFGAAALAVREDFVPFAGVRLAVVLFLALDLVVDMVTSRLHSAPAPFLHRLRGDMIPSGEPRRSNS
jgi:hypothetical protein